MIPADDSPAPPSAWTVAGTSTGKIDGRDFVKGSHRYTSDIKLPDMLHGRIVRPSAIGATLDTVDTSAAESRLGVVVVRDGDFVGVAAPTARSPNTPPRRSRSPGKKRRSPRMRSSSII